MTPARVLTSKAPQHLGEYSFLTHKSLGIYFWIMASMKGVDRKPTTDSGIISLTG